MRRLRVENFLSLRNINISLTKLNVLIGPNASGKSNFAKLFQLLYNVASTGLPELQGYTFRDLVYCFDETLRISIELSFEVDGGEASYLLWIHRDGYEEELRAGGETLVRAEGEPSHLVVHSKLVEDLKPARGLYRVEGTPFYRLDSPLLSRGSGKSNLLSKYLRYSVLRDRPRILLERLPALAAISDFLQSASIHSLDPRCIRGSIEVRAQPKLDFHGCNLARALLQLKLEDLDTFHRVEEAIKSLVPEVEEVVPYIIPGTDEVELRLRARGLGLLKPHNISDGTLRMLAIATILYTTDSLVFIDEPENSIHPHLLEALVDLARDSPAQVVIATHSPTLLDYVEPREVLIVDKVGAETRAARIEDPETVDAVRKYLEKGGTLGELWYSGALGGTP